MQRKRGVLILLLISLFLPTLSYAQEKTTPVGISFSEVDTPRQPSPSDRVTPVNNVLPTTTAFQAATPRYKGALPQTGEFHSVRLRFIGLLCLIVCYWLFLFLRMNEEEEHYDKEM